jgi:hypothetical protein
MTANLLPVSAGSLDRIWALADTDVVPLTLITRDPPLTDASNLSNSLDIEHS